MMVIPSHIYPLTSLHEPFYLHSRPEPFIIITPPCNNFLMAFRIHPIQVNLPHLPALVAVLASLNRQS
jgi:hypothetical protein